MKWFFTTMVFTLTVASISTSQADIEFTFAQRDALRKKFMETRYPGFGIDPEQVYVGRYASDGFTVEFTDRSQFNYEIKDNGKVTFIRSKGYNFLEEFDMSAEPGRVVPNHKSGFVNVLLGKTFHYYVPVEDGLTIDQSREEQGRNTWIKLEKGAEVLAGMVIQGRLEPFVHLLVRNKKGNVTLRIYDIPVKDVAVRPRQTIPVSIESDGPISQIPDASGSICAGL